jgi:indole-3-glycerol phosphate synthase
MIGDLLQAVVAAAEKAAVERERAAGWEPIERARKSHAPRGDAFRASLVQPGIRVIAECKRRSPSRGVLRAQYRPTAIAAAYERAGAAAISVLTEPTFFDGSLDHLRDVRGMVRLPILRKDFIVTDYQVAEAAAAGADAVLLIVAALPPRDLVRLLRLAESYGLAALVEVHDAAELEAAVEAGAHIIGVNSRNLRTLEVHQSVLDALVPAIPDDAIAVAESGLKTGEDLSRLSAAGYDAFLIGERFMLDTDPGAALAALLRTSAAAS